MNLNYVQSDKAWQVCCRDEPCELIPDPRPTKGGKHIPKRRNFKKKPDALQYMEYVRQQKLNLNISLSPSEKIEYKKVTDMLKDAKIETSLIDIVSEYIRHRPIKTDKTVGQCYDEFIAWYAERVEKGITKKKTHKSIQRCRPALEPFFDRNISDFENPMVAKELANHIRSHWGKLDPSSLDKGFSTTKTFLGWCKKREYLSKQPLHDGLTEVDGLKKNEAVNVLTPDEARRILHVAQQTDDSLGMLTYWIINLLVGTRPGELEALDWKNINIDDEGDEFIFIGDGKTARPRRIHLDEFPTVIKWLRLCDRTKPIFPKNFYNRRTEVLKSAGLFSDKPTTEERNRCKNIGRHSVATYLRIGGASQHTIATRVGNSVPVLEQHYQNNARRKSEAKEYFIIEPLNLDENIVKFGGIAS